jgi:hypothetical protein
MSSLIQWNCNGFYKHNTDINRIKYEQNPDIICLQETNFKNLQIGNINGYKGYNKNRPDAVRASDGVATYIKNNINSKELNFGSNSNSGHSQDNNSIVASLTEIIVNAANMSIGKSSRSKATKTAPWWNPECNEAIKNYKKKLNRFKKTKSLSDHIALKKARAESRIITKNSKWVAWKVFVSTINQQTSATTMWNKIKTFKGNKFNSIPNIMKYKDEYIKTNMDIAQAFADLFQTNNSNQSHTESFLKHKNEVKNSFITDSLPQHSEDSYNCTISMDEFNQAFLKCRSKSPGPDDIPYIFLHHLSSFAQQKLLLVYNLIWEYGFFPNQWRKAIIIPIPKSDKNKFYVENYRPISLISTLCKVLEKIINSRLIWHLEVSNKFNKEQCGFRKNHSTLNTSSNIHSHICNVAKVNQHTILVALDITKAYDMVWKQRVILILREWNISGNMITFITNFLQDRSFQTKIGETLSTTHVTENGVPQGSVISVTLFLIAINNMFDNLLPPIKYTIFADDCNIFCNGVNIKTTVELIQQALDELLKWSTTTGFNFSPSKTQCIIFYKKCNQNLLHINLNNIILLYTDKIKILGMTFDHKLNWNPHLKNLKINANNNMKIIKTLSHHSWGSDKNSLITKYKAIILAKMEYGAVIYNTAKNKILNILNPIHNQGIRLATGAFRTSPTASIMYNAGELPLEFRRTKETLKFVTKFSNNKTLIPIRRPLNIRNSPNTPRTIDDTYKNIADTTKFKPITFNKIIFPSSPQWMWNIKINTQLLEFNKKISSTSTIRNNRRKIPSPHKNLYGRFKNPQWNWIRTYRK